MKTFQIFFLKSWTTSNKLEKETVYQNGDMSHSYLNYKMLAVYWFSLV